MSERLEERYAEEEDTLRHMATTFSYAVRSRDLESAANAIATLRAEVARLTAERDAWRDPVLDGWAVYSEIPEPGRYPMGADGVSLVLDAVARLARRSLTTEGGDR